jgi:hypothetical protein
LRINIFVVIGVVDALGGMLKAHARRLVLSRKMSIDSASDFLRASKTLDVTLMEYTTVDVDNAKIEFDEPWMSSTTKIRYAFDSLKLRVTPKTFNHGRTFSAT